MNKKETLQALIDGKTLVGLSGEYKYRFDENRGFVYCIVGQYRWIDCTFDLSKNKSRFEIYQPTIEEDEEDK